MFPLKVPGPNGMPPLFFQHFWPKVGEVVTKTVLDFLNSGMLLQTLMKLMWCLFQNVKSRRKLLIIDRLIYVMWCIKLHPKLLLTS